MDGVILLLILVMFLFGIYGTFFYKYNKDTLILIPSVALTIFSFILFLIWMATYAIIN